MLSYSALACSRSVFLGGYVSGAGCKSLGDGDGLLSVIDDVISFHGDNLLFIFEGCFSRGLCLSLFLKLVYHGAKKNSYFNNDMCYNEEKKKADFPKVCKIG